MRADAIGSHGRTGQVSATALGSLGRAGKLIGGLVRTFVHAFMDSTYGILKVFVRDAKMDRVFEGTSEM